MKNLMSIIFVSLLLALPVSAINSTTSQSPKMMSEVALVFQPTAESLHEHADVSQMQSALFWQFPIGSEVLAGRADVFNELAMLVEANYVLLDSTTLRKNATQSAVFAAMLHANGSFLGEARALGRAMAYNEVADWLDF